MDLNNDVISAERRNLRSNKAGIRNADFPGSQAYTTYKSDTVIFFYAHFIVSSCFILSLKYINFNNNNDTLTNASP